ncbi:MAG: sulfite exporter TauE/SafE family protein [Vicinamibacterales bacterium]|nr:sulfite exporter TauE/SafE family protein [Vicinamibacterales bacterium]
MPDFTPFQWTLAILAAYFSGVSKAGLTGMGMLGVTFMAAAIPGRASTGVVLPLLIFADLIAASTFRKHVQWAQLKRLAWPVCLGIVGGWGLLMVIPDAAFRPVIGAMVLAMLALQAVRQRFPRFDAALPHSPVFAWVAGLLTGTATMVANAAGPIASTYLIILSFPKRQFVHTMAWLFLFVNLIKVPFGVQLGLINPGSLALNACLIPAVLAGLWSGKRIVECVAPDVFQKVVLGFSGASAAWLLLR